jgi:hypothetical protein
MLETALAYVESLYGCPYGYWTGRPIQRDNTTPFYAALPNEPLPARNTLVSQGIACTGLLNLMCRRAGLVVPGVLDSTEDRPGGTLVWGGALPWIRMTATAATQPTPGTLFFRHYRSVDDPGHVAIVARDGVTLLQSYPEPWDPLRGVLSPPGVTFTPLPEVVVIDDTEVACYYDSFCPPAIYVSALQR